MEGSRPLLVGITGGIGSGKSLVSRLFTILGAPVYDADSRAKWLMNHNENLKSAIKKQFGSESYRNDVLDNSFLAGKVFGNPEQLAILNSFVHPAVAVDFESWVNKNRQYPYLVKEAALLIEAGSYKSLDKLITVFSPEDLRIRRVLKRDPQRTVEQVRDIIKRQLPDSDKIKLADYIITNDENHMIIPQVFRLHQSFININSK